MTSIKKANLRAYNVGFGDCLLLWLDYDDGVRRSILIDFGSTELPLAFPRNHLDWVAEDIRDVVEGRRANDDNNITSGSLQMLVATHRHADHISGFGRAKAGAIIKGLQPRRVVQPWTENPRLPTNARAPITHRRLVSTMDNMQLFAAGARWQADKLSRLHRFPDGLGARLRFLGEKNISNDEAVRALQAMADGTEGRYVTYGDDISDERLLPEVTIKVLGPPTLRDAPSIARQAQLNDEFWHLASQWGQATKAGDASTEDLGPLFLPAMSHVPQAARWLTPRIDRANADNMMALLRTMDTALNNTSVILQMRIGESMLVFPGDAQIENWSWLLFDAMEAGDDQAEQFLADLKKTNVYKVGHHGSLNATPKTLWKNFAHKGSRDKQEDRRLITVLSTLEGKHGSRDDNTEVPRQTLLKALKAESNLYTTEIQKNPRYTDIPISV